MFTQTPTTACKSVERKLKMIIYFRAQTLLITDSNVTAHKKFTIIVSCKRDQNLSSIKFINQVRHIQAQSASSAPLTHRLAKQNNVNAKGIISQRARRFRVLKTPSKIHSTALLNV